MRDVQWEYQATEVRKMRKLMKYTEVEFKKDWEVAVAMAQIMAVEGYAEHRQFLLDDAMMRILAYISNNPDARPWNGDAE